MIENTLFYLGGLATGVLCKPAYDWMKMLIGKVTALFDKNDKPQQPGA